MRCRSIPLIDLQPDEFVFFASYALVGLTFLASSFLFTLLEYYGLQLQHLSSHSLTLVAIFVHFCDMFICVWPLVRLFRLFHVLRSSRRSPTHLSPLLLPALGQGSGHVHRVPYPWQVGPVERRLGDRAAQRPRTVGAAVRCPDGQAR
jgi:hypothetical protein